MKAIQSWRLPLFLAGCGLLLTAAFFLQPVTVIADGKTTTLRGFYLTAADALRGAGLAVGGQDQVQPPLNAWLPPDAVVRVTRAHTVSLWSAAGPVSFGTTDRLPGNWLARAGLAVYPGDRLLLNGLPADPNTAVSGAGPFALQFEPAAALRVSLDGETRLLYTSAATLGEALWQAGLAPGAGDRLSLPLQTSLAGVGSVELRRAREFTIQIGAREVRAATAALTVGEALLEAGLPPQGLDQVSPGEDESLPADRRVRLVRGRETVALAEELLPYGNQFTTTPELELDQRQVIQPGRYGVVISRERVRYSDEVEVERVREGKWTAAEPQDQITGMGTTAVVKTLDTGGGTIEYYRAVTMYATSYSPCQQGLGRCSRATSSGIPLEKGVVAVTGAWYRLFAGARVYIPGYGFGVIGDVGGGVPGTYWIDLGYSDEDYEAWHQNVTVYFLTPIPATVPAILP